MSSVVPYIINPKRVNKKDEDIAVIDRMAYVRGKLGYPTAPPESLPQWTTARYRTCYEMGYNYQKFLKLKGIEDV